MIPCHFSLWQREEKETKWGGFNLFQEEETSKKCLLPRIRHWQVYADNYNKTRLNE